MADEDYGDDDAFYFDDDDYLYVEDDYAIAVSPYSTLSLTLPPRKPAPKSVPSFGKLHVARIRLSNYGTRQDLVHVENGT